MTIKLIIKPPFDIIELLTIYFIHNKTKVLPLFRYQKRMYEHTSNEFISNLCISKNSDFNLPQPQPGPNSRRVYPRSRTEGIGV